MPQLPAVFGIPVDFILFALTLLGGGAVAPPHAQGRTYGLVVISFYKIVLYRF